MIARIFFLFLVALLTARGSEAAEPRLLSDPFLQLPEKDSVRVVWFTEFRGTSHFVRWGPALKNRTEASSFRLSRMFEDKRSHPANATPPMTTTPRVIWRHEAIIAGLRTGERVPYTVSSRTSEQRVSSALFTASALPATGQALQILLTSDHQLKPMTPANLQKVVETVGEVDAVFFAGDLVGIPDRASEWFDDNRGLGFFPTLQGRARYHLERRRILEGGATEIMSTPYHGGAIIQNAPLFPSIGNHEVMGRFYPHRDLDDQYIDPIPAEIARANYARLQRLDNRVAGPVIEAEWLQNNSYNTVSYEEIFSLPDESPGGERYYAIRFGDVFLISLFATRNWRSPRQEAVVRGKYQEVAAQVNQPKAWGYGSFPFEDLAKGSPQYEWLSAVLKSDAFTSAPIRVAMLHNPIHGLGDNVIPAFTPPQQVVERASDGTIKTILYTYPPKLNMLLTDIKPLLEEAGVNLIVNGDSHLWNRFQSPAGTHYLESSNVGNTFGCFVDGSGRERQVPVGISYPEFAYPAIGDPAGLRPQMPSVYAPMQGEDGDLPCVASNYLTVFSILDTGRRAVRSYVFDTRAPHSPARLFDEFSLETSMLR